MKRAIVRVAMLLCLGSAGVTLTAPPASAQSTNPATATAPAEAPDPARDATREKLRALLAVQGPKMNVEFHQIAKAPYNFAGSLTTGLNNVSSLEIVIIITKTNTIGFRVYPHYKDAYINLDRVKDSARLARKLANYNDHNFLFWGADDTSDVFCAYTFTLESGFPDAGITIVLRSIAGTDKFVGEMRPLIDGSPAP